MLNVNTQIDRPGWHHGLSTCVKTLYTLCLLCYIFWNCWLRLVLVFLIYCIAVPTSCATKHRKLDMLYWGYSNINIFMYRILAKNQSIIWENGRHRARRARYSPFSQIMDWFEANILLKIQLAHRYRPLAVTSQLQLLSAMLEGKVKVWNTEMSTNVKRATRKGLLPDYYSILAIIFNIIHVFFSKTFFVLFCFPSYMAAKYAVRHVWRHAKVVYRKPRLLTVA